MDIDWNLPENGWFLGARIHDSHLVEIRYRYPEILRLTFLREDGTHCTCEFRDIAHCTIDMQDIDILLDVFAWKTDKQVRGHPGQDEAVRILYKNSGFARAHEFIEMDNRKRGAEILWHFTFNMDGEIACRARHATFRNVSAGDEIPANGT